MLCQNKKKQLTYKFLIMIYSIQRQFYNKLISLEKILKQPYVANLSSPE